MTINDTKIVGPELAENTFFHSRALILSEAGRASSNGLYVVSHRSLIHTLHASLQIKLQIRHQ